MNYSNFTAALDIGSTHITLAIATKTTQGDINVIDIESAPISSIKYGKIVNESAIAKEIQSLILKIQQRQKATIDKIYISTSSAMLYSERISLNKALGDGSIITQELLDKMNNSEELNDLEDKSLELYCEPVYYRLDGEKIAEPVGKACQRIEAEYLKISADKESISRIKASLKQAEIKMAEIFISPQTIAEATLTPAEMKAGVAAIEVGHATTKIAVYKDDQLQYATCIPLGSNLIIRDLSNTLNISYALAEDTYMDDKFGSVCTSLVEDLDIELSTKNDIKKIFPSRYVVEVIEARLEEILLNIKFQLEQSGFMYLLSEGLVLSGSITNIKNLTHFVSLKTNINARIADLKSCLSGSNEKALTAEDAELCGILLLGHNNCKKEEKVKEVVPVQPVPEKKKEKKKIFRGMRNLFDDFFEEEDTSL